MPLASGADRRAAASRRVVTRPHPARCQHEDSQDRNEGGQGSAVPFPGRADAAASLPAARGSQDQARSRFPRDRPPSRAFEPDARRVIASHRLGQAGPDEKVEGLQADEDPARPSRPSARRRAVGGAGSAGRRRDEGPRKSTLADSLGPEIARGGRGPASAARTRSPKRPGRMKDTAKGRRARRGRGTCAGPAGPHGAGSSSRAGQRAPAAEREEGQGGQEDHEAAIRPGFAQPCSASAPPADRSHGLGDQAAPPPVQADLPGTDPPAATSARLW